MQAAREMVLRFVYYGLAASILFAPRIASGQTSWSRDQNQNRIDDPIDAVQTGGLPAAFEDGDLNGRKLISVFGTLPPFSYGIYVKYASLPTAADAAALQGLGLTTRPFHYIPYIQSRATYLQIQLILGLPRVVRVEAIPVFYPTNDNATKAMRAAVSNYALHPATVDLGFTGRGVVIAILDSGVNDAPDPVTGYTGHESLIGKFVGGGNFSNPDPMLNTPIHLSENPVDRSPDFSHGSHVAGTAMGTGGPSGLVTDGNYGFYRGIAPDARLVDCKVLSDAGVGGGAADGLEWCIYHRQDDWGLTGPDSVCHGVQVVNMSLGDLLEDSDGTDATSQAANAAVKAGLVVCISTGNDGNTGYISSPSAADLAISVGASVDANTVSRADDVVADFSNEGPRRDDGDADHLDEMKPSIVPPGGGITSVEGRLIADGHTYVTVNGTSMSSPMAAGMCALIIQAAPGIQPYDVKRIIQDTAEHRTTAGKQPPSAADPFGLDPNYHPSWGWGNPDVFAAVLEARYPGRTQVVSGGGEAVLGGIDVRWETQREIALAGFNVLRADPLYGARGAFRALNGALVPPAGSPEIHLTSNRHAYTYPDRDPSLVVGETYWYRVEWKDTVGRLHQEPAFPVVYDPPTPLATVQWSITHDYMDNDLLVIVGSGPDASEPTLTARFFFPGQGTGAADSMKINVGDPWFGTKRWFYHRTLTDRDFGAAQVLPPSAENPWFLSVTEGGFVNTNGRIEDFRITFHGPGGDVISTPLVPVFPLQTVEEVTHVVWIPNDPLLTLNHAPALDPVGGREALEGRTLEFQISASDPDGDALTYTAPSLPPGAAFDPGTRTFTWSPGHDAVTATTLVSATFEVDDTGGNSDAETVEIRLHDVDPDGNLPPYWTPLPDQSVVAGNRLAFKVSAVDPEGNPLTYSATVLPPGATFDPLTRCFAWDADQALYGEFTALFAVSDGSHPAVTDEVQIDVKFAPVAQLECANQLFAFAGTSSVGSDDLGIADHDTIHFQIATPVVRLLAELRWVGAPVVDLDYRLHDAEGNVVGVGASLGEPEVLAAANLAPGAYYFEVLGFTVPVETDWILQVDKCAAVDVPGILSQFAAHPGEDGVRLEWATGDAGFEGFHVYRSRTEDGEYLRVNTALVRGDGVYQFEDGGPFDDFSGGTAYYVLAGVSWDGAEARFGPMAVNVAGIRPLRFQLAQNQPNPFQSPASTRIRFRLPEASRVRLDLFDLRGARVRTLAQGVWDEGEHEVTWDGATDRGARAAAGVYFYRLEVPGKYVETRAMVLTR